MKTEPLSPEDPRLTLYALGEMPAAERAGFEQQLAQDPAAQQIVAEIRAMAGIVTAALEQEPVETAKPAGKILRFPQAYFMISGLAAACFAVAFVFWQNNQELKRESYLIEVPLAQAGSLDKAAAPAAAPVAMPTPAVTLGRSEPVTANVAAAGNAARAEADERRAVQFEVAERAAREQSALVAKQAVSARKAKVAASPKQAATGALADTLTAANEPVTLSAFNVVAAGAPMSPPPPKDAPQTEAYAYRADNLFRRVADQPLSTFSIDVDTAAYANVRRFLSRNERPPVDAVRIEELVNYFPYDYAPPTNGQPFAAHLEVAAAPWAPEHRLVRIGLKGREIAEAQRPAANLVFLLDVSGSMDEPNKLPLVKQSLRLLVEKLRDDDRVAIAVYAGASGLALPSTSAREKAKILAAIDELRADGSTNGAMGIHLAYDIAKANFVAGGVNRVILATDGDFNVGTTSEGELVRLIQEKARSGVFLSVLGFGMGNLKDSTLEQLADKGNGNYAYIDSLAEARKALVEQVGGTLVTIAKDVKIQVEFNPAQVQAYRLIGYENRLLAKEDFNNDQVDAGEIGAGHTVTALYEVVPVGVETPPESPAVDGLKYQVERTLAVRAPEIPSKVRDPRPAELLTVKIRYKEPAGDISSKLEFPLVDAGARFADASADFKFATAVAGFGMALRDSPHPGRLTLGQVLEWGRAGLGQDAGGYRAEFLSLVDSAGALLR
jgi:Ca-activated chloride channel family protein